MDLTDLRDFSRRFANTNSTKFSDTDVDASINSFLDEFSADIINAMDGWDVFGEVATTDIVADQQEYCFPTNTIWVKRVEVTYDGTNWNKLTFFDINERNDATDSTSISSDFSSSAPFGDIHDESVFLYPVPSSSVTGGMKLWYIKLPDQLTNTTDTPGFIRIFHKLLAYGAAKDHLEQFINESGNTERLIQCEKNINRLVSKMKMIYNKHNQDRDYVARAAYVDYDYGNN